VVGVVTWLAAAREDVGLLANEYLPEFLLISVLLAVVWAIRRPFRRNGRPS
jgi:hypothetical protein